MKRSGREKKIGTVEKSTGMKPALDCLGTARYLWELDKLFDPGSSFADMYKAVEDDERIFHKSSQSQEREKDVRSH